MSVTLKSTVPLMAKTLGLETPLVGRPGDVAFGPFTFYDPSLELTAAAGNNQINDVNATRDKKLRALDSNRRYWLYLRGFSCLLSVDSALENQDTLEVFLANQYIGMERNQQFTYEQLAYGVTPAVPTSGDNGIQASYMPPSNPNFMFKHWWVLDGESDSIFQNTDINTPMADDVGGIFWFFGFAIGKSIQAQVEMPKCGLGALEVMEKQGPMSLATYMALLSRA